MAGEPDLDELFRCEKWACTLAVKHCLRRQRETREGGRNQKIKTVHPVHPHCASGECDQGRAIALRLTGHEIAPKPPTRSAPRLDIIQAVEARQAKGDTMPKGYARGAACKTCGSTGTKHKMGCAEDGVDAPPAAPKKLRAVPPRKPSAAAREGKVEAMEVDELVELRNLVDEELGRRQAELLRQLAAVKAAIGEAA